MMREVVDHRDAAALADDFLAAADAAELGQRRRSLLEADAGRMREEQHAEGVPGIDAAGRVEADLADRARALAHGEARAAVVAEVGHAPLVGRVEAEALHVGARPGDDVEEVREIAARGVPAGRRSRSDRNDLFT